jgi:GTP-binding protein EngB required for normal cell division
MGDTAYEPAEDVRDTVYRPSIDGVDRPGELSSVLAESIDRLSALGDGFAAPLREVRVLHDRLVEGRFHLAVLGQFKRGKSSLLNALLGEPILPTSVVPLTAIPTLLHPASHPLVRVKFADGAVRKLEDGTLAQRAAFLAAFVTEKGNPKNRLRVDHVEVYSAAPILARGVVLIDTPGIGSTLKHNTEATLNFLPQCDAAMFLVSADPPITDVEVEFLRQVAAKVPRLMFVLNKVDYLDAHERGAALDFLRQTLKENAGIIDPEPIFLLSARQGIEARIENDSALWQRSGMAELEQYLVEFLAREKSAALHSAIARKAREQIHAALLQVGLISRSLQMPVADLEARLQIFAGKLDAIKRERLAARDLMLGGKKRILAGLEDEAGALRKRCQRHIEETLLGSAAVSGDGALTERAINEALEDIIPAFFERELGEATRAFEKQISEELRTHQIRADSLIETVRQTAAQLFEIPYHVPESAEAFRLMRKPYWVTHKWESAINPIPATWLDALFPASTRLGRIMRRVRHQIDALVVHNVENLRWAVLQSVEDAFRRYALEFDQRLQETISATTSAIQTAMKKRNECQNEVAPELRRLEDAAQRLRCLQTNLEYGETLREDRAAGDPAPAIHGRT